jgi:hypothetical protein
MNVALLDAVSGGVKTLIVEGTARYWFTTKSLPFESTAMFTSVESPLPAEGRSVIAVADDDVIGDPTTPRDASVE